MDLPTILCSILGALVGYVTPNLRAVYVDFPNGMYRLCFYYDQPPTEDEAELASLADTEFIADFPRPDYETDFEIFTIPYPQNIPNTGYCAYLRYEKKS